MLSLMEMQSKESRFWQYMILVLLRIPSSRPSPRTFPQFVRVQVLGFLAAENDGFET